MEGWQCPICKKVYSPFVTSCFQCGENNTRISTGTEYITNLLEPSFGECPHFKSESSGLMCRQSSTCDKPCKSVELYNMCKSERENDVNICDSCTNKKCSLQSGVKRTQCDMYESESEV